MFVLLVETGFHYVGQADLELLPSGDPSSLSAGIRVVSHRARPLVSSVHVHTCHCALQLLYVVFSIWQMGKFVNCGFQMFYVISGFK